MNISIDRVNSGRVRVRTGCAAMAALCIALTSAAAADDRLNQPLTSVVSYADLNLNGQSGAETMYLRLQWAAQRVCEPLGGRGLKAVQRSVCIDQAIARAIDQVDKPVLTAYHRARTGPADARLALAKGSKKAVNEKQ